MLAEKPYPYFLSPEGRYHLHMAPIGSLMDRLDFFYKYKRPSENIYRGMIGKTDVSFEGMAYVLKIFTEYLTNDYYQHPANRDTNLPIKLFPKLCWLTDEYLSGGFKHPVCLHYNPRTRKNVMHPGSTRNYVLDLFHKKFKLECLYFNTGGVEFDFMRSMKVVEKEELLRYQNLHMNIAFDHCSTIPHINLDDQCITDNIPVWQERVKSKLSDPSFRIYMDNEIEILKKWQSSEEDASVKIYIENPTNRNEIVRACLLAVTGHAYQSETLKVVV